MKVKDVKEWNTSNYITLQQRFNKVIMDTKMIITLKMN